MKRNRQGDVIEFETEIGEFEFKDPNGIHTVKVGTDGEFWREVWIEHTPARAFRGTAIGSLLPKAARRLAKLLLKAADKAEQEERLLKQEPKPRKRKTA